MADTETGDSRNDQIEELLSDLDRDLTEVISPLEDQFKEDLMEIRGEDPDLQSIEQGMASGDDPEGSSAEFDDDGPTGVDTDSGDDPFAGMDLGARGWCAKPGAQGGFNYNSYGMVANHVQVDILTGEVQILRTDILFDCGQRSEGWRVSE